MKELYIAPELEIVTFVPVEQLAAGYLEGYARTIGTSVTRNGEGDPSEGDIDIPVDNGEGSYN